MEVALGPFFKKSKPWRSGQAAAEVHVAAFGKHPGWDDHIEDLGIETSLLVAIKRMLYTQGVGGNVDSGGWEKLGEQDRLDGFHHAFLWHTVHGLILGRMWSSSDGKGRTRYPMVACAQVNGLSLDWAFDRVLPLLENIEARCIKTPSAVTVRAVIRDAEQMLSHAVQGAEPAREALAPSPRALAEVADRPEMGPGRQGIHRILYTIEREMAAYRLDAADASLTATALLRASHVRVPWCAGTLQAAVRLWLSFLLDTLDPAAPLLFLLPVGQPWLDIIVGEAGAQHLFCVRASLQGVPLATEIPYNFDDAFRARCENEINESRGGPPPPDPVRPEPAPAAPPPAVEPAAPPAAEQKPAPEAEAPPQAPSPEAMEPEPPPVVQEAEGGSEAPIFAARETVIPIRTEPAPEAAWPDRASPKPARKLADPLTTQVAAPKPRPAPVRPAAAGRDAATPTERGTVSAIRVATTPEAEWADRQRMEALARPGVGRRLLRLWPVLLILLILAVLALVSMPLLFPTPPPAPKKQAEAGPFVWVPEEHGKAWQELCRAYKGWFPAFHKKLTKERLADWRRDAGLVRLIVMQVDAAGDEAVDPRDIAGVAGGDYEDLGRNPPKAVRTRQGAERSRHALAIVKGVEDSITQWPSFDELSLKPLAKAFAERGWSRQAAELEAAAASLTPGPHLAEAIDAALKIKLQAAAIEVKARKIAQQEQAVSVLGNAAAARIHDDFLAETRGAETPELLLARVSAVDTRTAGIADGCAILNDLEKTIRSMGDDGLAQGFLAAVRAAAGSAGSLEGIAASLASVKPAAQTVQDCLKEIKARRDDVEGTKDKLLADKLWSLVGKQATGAKSLAEFGDKLQQTRGDVAAVAARRKEIEAQREALKPLGDAFLARHAEHLAAAAAKAGSLADLVSALDTVKAAGDTIIASWAKAAAARKAFDASGDKVLAAFGPYVAAEVAAVADLDALAAKLDALARSASALAEFLRADWDAGKIDRGLFAKESDVHRTFDGKMAAATLDAWRKEVADYARLEKADPRQPDAWKADLDDLHLRIEFLKDEADPAKRRLADQSETRCKQLDADVQKSLQLAWIRKNEAAIAQRAAAVAAEFEGIKNDLKDAMEPPRAWLARIRGPKPLASSRAVNDEWAKRRDALVPPGATEAGLLKDRRAYMKLWRDVEALRLFLSRLDDEKQLPASLPDSVKAGADAARQAVAKALAARRELALQAALAAIPWTDRKVPALDAAQFQQRDEWLKVAKDYTQWREATGNLLLAVGTIEALLDAGYGPDVRMPGAPASIRVRDVYRALREKKVDRELLEFTAPTLERVAKLLAIEGLNRKQLVERAQAPAGDDPPQAMPTVWRKLGETKDWPSDLAELRLEAALEQRVLDAAKKLEEANPPIARRLADEVARQKPLRWETCFNRVASRADARDLADADVAAVVKLADSFRVAPERLSGETQLRRKLFHFRQMAGALRDEEPKDKLAPLVTSFVGEIAALGDAAKQPAAAQMLADLQAFAREKVADDPTAGLEKAGPAGGQLAAQWKARVADEGKSVVFSWADAGHALTFVRVEPKGGTARPCYLCTVEAPVGLFLDTVRTAGRWVDMAVLVGRPERLELDTRRGPRTWEWKRLADEMYLARKWLAAEATTANPYAPVLGPGQPSLQHPVQYISAPAALEFAWLLGCRLPSAAEWQGAFDASQKGKAAAVPNLRDAAWRKQQDFMREKAKTIVPEWPDAGIFLPAGVAPKEGAAALAVTEQDDGLLWFDVAGTGSEFRHLAGNVAEFVFDQPPVLDEAIFGGARPPTTATFSGLAQKHAPMFGVIGGSALSPPELWDGKEKPFGKAWPIAFAKENARDAFCDVGIRLAFTAPREAPADQLRRILRKCGYLADAAK